MRILPLILLLGFLIKGSPDTGHPHGESFKVTCSKCHSTNSWAFDRSVYTFDHNTTRMPLKGQHSVADCRGCHKSLIFSQAKGECFECHTDIHEATVGSDCSRCHTPVSWLVNNITEIHQRGRFPLVGAHRSADCIACHKSQSKARYDVLGTNCIDCHRADYQATTAPNHASAGFSEDCSGCHPINAFQWTGVGFNHSFFPLTLGHSGIKCASCHTAGNYSSLSQECSSCHITDFNNTVNPAHQAMGFSTTCNLCHSTSPGWKPASFTQHDTQSFPIYSGKHKETWNTCTQCHPNPAAYSDFTCLSCHEHNKTSMDSKHSGESGYTYVSSACLNCHPTGRGDK